MKPPKHFFNLEWNKNKNNSCLIYFNLSYGYKEFNPLTHKSKYVPLRISTEYNIQKEYWIGRPTYRANRNYSVKFGKELNTTLQNIEDMAYHQLKLFRNENKNNPSPSKLKYLILEKLGRVDKIVTDVEITDYIESAIDYRRNLPNTSSEYWSIDTEKQYRNLKNYILKYEEQTKTTLTLQNINEKTYWNYFKTVNEIKKKKTGKYFSHNTIANQCKRLLRILKLADENDININFKYSKKEYKIHEQDSSFETFLTEKQLTTIINTNVNGLYKKYEHARNYLIISSLTGLRIGDMVHLHKIKPEIIKHDTKDYFCFYTKIRKSKGVTKELAAVIPILKPVREILEVNNNKFPSFPSQTNIRKYIKDFLKFLEFDNPIIKTYYDYLQEPQPIEYKQHQLFRPHDCRSTFITNLKQLEVQNETLEPITHPKHGFQSILEKYDKSSLNDNAVKLIKAINSKDSEIFSY